jgi:hypothetical protein
MLAVTTGFLLGKVSDVRYWPLADIRLARFHVRFRV